MDKCERCDQPSHGQGLCNGCIADDMDYDDNGCANCNGEGFVSHCFTEYACIYPDEGCEECMRRCDWCNAPKLTPEQQAERDALQRVLSDALAPHTPKDRP